MCCSVASDSLILGDLQCKGTVKRSIGPPSVLMASEATPVTLCAELSGETP